MIRKPLPNIWGSYGCQDNILDFLPALEVLRLQSINRASYGGTIARCQSKFRLQKMIVFTCHYDDEFINRIYLFDEKVGARKLTNKKIFNFEKTVTVVVNKDLYAFKWGKKSVQVYKITNCTSKDQRVKTSLPILKGKNYLEAFAVTYWSAGGSIVLTGGSTTDSDRNSHDSAQTFQMDVQTDSWRKDISPALNVARRYLTSCAMGQQVYVACGLADEALSSVEILRQGAVAWELIEIPDFLPRWDALFCQIDESNLVILGGIYGCEGRSRSSGVVLNAQSCALVKHIDPASDCEFYCKGQTAQRTAGQVVALVNASVSPFVRGCRSLRMISYNQATDTVTTVLNYGGDTVYYDDG